MSNEKPRPRFPAGINAEERKVWASFYTRVGKDPLLAAELIAELDHDAELKRMHLALYLISKECLRAAEQSRVLNQRIARALRWLCHLLLVAPMKLTFASLHRGTEIALTSLPDGVAGKPAVRHVKRIARNGASADLAVSNQRSQCHDQTASDQHRPYTG